MMIVILIACVAASKDSAAPADSGDTGAWPPASTPAQWGIDEASDVLKECMSYGVVESFTMRDWFLGLIMDEEVEDAACYTVETTDDGDLYSGWWEGTCVGASGYIFIGGWLYQQTEMIDGDVKKLTVSLLASFDGTSTDGVVDSVGGTLLITRISPTPGVSEFTLEAGGLWHAPGETGWLGTGVGAGLEISGTQNDALMSLSVEGGTAYGDDLYVYYSGISFDEASCGQAPMGDIWLRDPTGAWIVFAFGETCDGCADVSINGELLGESCVGDEVWEAASSAVTSIIDG